jgi:hypothetical protein
MLAVLKLYLASLQRQYYVGRTVKEGLKKPLNPFLGELFFCEFRDDDLNDEKASSSTVKVVSEQVSHHPPTTACYLEAKEHGVRAEAYSTQQTTLSGTSIVIRQAGHAVLTVDNYEETYLLPLPDVCARSVISGVPWPELDGVYRIVGSSGYAAEMRFHAKGFWGGERNAFEASVYRTADADKKAAYTLFGCWSSRFHVLDVTGTEIDVFDLKDPHNAPAPRIIKPIEEQHPWESRRAWRPTFDAIRNGQHDLVSREKSKLEHAQREMRKSERDTCQEEWETMFFSNGEVSGVVEKLMEELDPHEAARLRGRNGCWRFDRDKERMWRNGSGSFRLESPMG